MAEPSRILWIFFYSLISPTFNKYTISIFALNTLKKGYSITPFDKLWQNQDSPWTVWPNTGLCRNRENLLEYARIGRSDTCIRRRCVYSAVTNSHIDTSELILSRKRVDCLDNQDDIRASGGQISNVDIPIVSFIFTLHNNPAIAIAGILEVWRTAHEVDSAEFIIYNDGSTVDMSSVTFLLDELQTLYNTKISWYSFNISLGYGPSNNKALSYARGKYALLMNSDVMMMPGCLSLLLHTMEGFRGDEVGMVGPMMLFPKGMVMESGGVVYQGGIPGNMGRWKHPKDLPYIYARVVDYISAACLLVRRELFLKLNLFDPQFEPAYYEDTDAAMTMLTAGYVTVLQPLAVVLHYEGYSISNKEKNYLMQRNQKLFAKKHVELLSKYCPAPSASCPEGMDSALSHQYISFIRQDHRILVLEDIIPEDDRDSGSVRTIAILQILRDAGYSVTFEGNAHQYHHVRYLLRLLAEGINVVMPGTLEHMASTSTSTSTSYGSNGNNIDRIIETTNRCPYEVIIIARRAVYSKQIKSVKLLCPHIPIIYDTVDVHFLREIRTQAFLNHYNKNNNNNNNKHKRDNKNDMVLVLNRKDMKKNRNFQMKDKELEFMKMSSTTLVVSSYELEMLNKIFKEDGIEVDVEVLSNIYDIPTYIDNNENNNNITSNNTRSGAIFVGNMLHDPNIYAIEFILRNIMSRVSELPEGFIMHLVLSRSNNHNNNKIIKEASKHPLIRIHRDISNEQLLSLHGKVKVVLAPLPYGAGVKGKVNYGLLHGVPVVASSFAIEGMHLTHRESVWVADSGEEYITAIRHLHENNSAWETLRSGGVRVMEQYFSRSVAEQTLLSLLTRLGSPPPSTRNRNSSSSSSSSISSRILVTNVTGNIYWKCPFSDEINAASQKDSHCIYDNNDPFHLPHPALLFSPHYLTPFDRILPPDFNEETFTVSEES
eukprot:gene4026-8016_t